MPPVTSLMRNRLMPLVHYCGSMRERKTCNKTKGTFQKAKFHFKKDKLKGKHCNLSESYKIMPQAKKRKIRKRARKSVHVHF